MVVSKERVLAHKNLEKNSAADAELKKEAKKATSLNANKIENKGIEQIIDASQFGSFDKLMRITSWVIRFIQNCRMGKKESVMGEILAKKILASETLWIKNLQLSLKNAENFGKTSLSLGVFTDGEGILRCGGRIRNSNLPYDTQHPKILPPEHYVTKLLIWKAHHKVYHNKTHQTLAQFRTKFWITRGSQVIKRLLNGCNLCRKLEGLAYGAPGACQKTV